MFDFFSNTQWPLLKFWVEGIAFLTSILLVFFIGVFIMRTQKIFRWRAIKEAAEFLKIQEVPRPVRAEAWLRVKKRMESQNPSDWKLAVLQADGILDDLLKRMGYDGEGLGERLKNIDPADFDSLDDVWVAHKMRNRIAHEPEANLAREDVEKAISLYEKGLKEFEYI